MSDRVLLPLPDGRWLELEQEAFEAALAAGAARMPNTRAAAASPTEDLVDAEQLADALKVPQTRLEDLARKGKIPIVRVGRYVRFSRRAVEAALSSNGQG